MMKWLGKKKTFFSPNFGKREKKPPLLEGAETPHKGGEILYACYSKNNVIH